MTQLGFENVLRFSVQHTAMATLDLYTRLQSPSHKASSITGIKIVPK
jgi:hypothetical protein